MQDSSHITRTEPTSPESAISGVAKTDLSIIDSGMVRVGGGFRLPAEVADSKRVRIGGGFRLPVA
jgi:hypothetical protein